MISICPYTWKKKLHESAFIQCCKHTSLASSIFCDAGNQFSPQIQIHEEQLCRNILSTSGLMNSVKKKKKKRKKKKVVSATTEHPVEKTCLERGLCIRLLYKLSVWTNTKFTLFKDRHITVINHTQSQIQTSPHYYASCKQLCSKTNCFHIKDQDLFGSQHVVVLCFPFCPLGPLESIQMKGPRCCFKHNGNRLSKYIRAGKKHVTYAFDERKKEMWRL